MVVSNSQRVYNQQSMGGARNLKRLSWKSPEDVSNQQGLGIVPIPSARWFGTPQISPGREKVQEKASDPAIVRRHK